jgi:hypothetical protein
MISSMARGVILALVYAPRPDSECVRFARSYCVADLPDWAKSRSMIPVTG